MNLKPKSPTAFVAVKKIKSSQSFGASFNHNYRVGDVPENAENERSYLNEEIIPLGETDYNTAFKTKIEEQNVFPRKNSVLGLEVVLEAQGVEDGFDLEDWKKKSAVWLQQYFGKDNVISAMYHGDESQPHIHAMIVPIVDGGLKCYKFTDGKDRLSEMQTSYAKAVEDLGLERGMERTPVSYEKMQRLRAITGKIADETLPAPRTNEPVADYYERANAAYTESRLIHFKKQNDTIVQAEKAIELAKREAAADIAFAQQRVEIVEQRFDELQKAMKPLVDENSDLRKKISDLEAQIKADQAAYSSYLKSDGLSLEDLRRAQSMKLAIEAFKQGLLGEQNDEKKRVAFAILDEAVAAYNQSHREQDIMTDRESGEDIDIDEA